MKVIPQKEKMIQAYEKQIAELKSGITGKVNTSMDFLQPVEKETIERLQENVTVLQTENLKLRRKLKDSGIDSMDVQKSMSVKFDSVITREFLPNQGQGVPSGGNFCFNTPHCDRCCSIRNGDESNSRKS